MKKCKGVGLDREAWENGDLNVLLYSLLYFLYKNVFIYYLYYLIEDGRRHCKIEKPNMRKVLEGRQMWG